MPVPRVHWHFFPPLFRTEVVGTVILLCRAGPVVCVPKGGVEPQESCKGLRQVCPLQEKKISASASIPQTEAEPSLSQATGKSPLQPLPPAGTSMLPTWSLCSIVWLNRGFKLRKAPHCTNTGQV
ncbi:hypothetical protein AGOR_G00241440 [Albula goreensis]|uniref:Uncharacterized protein n=1 Tax=Albula goreensis TaxID=1534307 RepID=A0A8T3CKC9_9TELE|nr:hypothetical protein AGOR_G00241440 [Albula goreensis]